MATTVFKIADEFNDRLRDILKLSAKYLGNNNPQVLRLNRLMNAAIKADPTFIMFQCEEYLVTTKPFIANRDFKGAYDYVNGLDSVNKYKKEDDGGAEVFSQVLSLYDDLTESDKDNLFKLITKMSDLLTSALAMSK